MKIPSLGDLYAALDLLRETLHTQSIREWFKEDFWMRTQVALEHIPALFHHAYTVETTYTIQIKDDSTGHVEYMELTELQIRDRFGDAVWEAAASARIANGGEDVYIGNSDLQNTWSDFLGSELEDVRWGQWEYDDDEFN